MVNEQLKNNIRALAYSSTHVAELQFIRANGEEVLFEDISDGYLNEVTHVYRASAPNSGVVIKYAPPYLKCMGPTYPLKPVRGLIEYNAYNFYNEICPGSAPLTYSHSENLIAVEDLTDFTVLKTELMAGKVDKVAIERLAYIISRIHAATHVLTIGESGLKILDERFPNQEMKELQRMHTHVHWADRNSVARDMSAPLAAQSDELVYDNASMLTELHQLMEIYRDRKDCLAHYDLHTGSVMVKEGAVKIIDSEFVTVGCATADIGYLLAHYLFSYIRHTTDWTDDLDMHQSVAEEMLKACEVTVRVYVDVMEPCIRKTDDVEETTKQMIREIAGFTGVELCRRMIGIGHSADVMHSAKAQLRAVHAGTRLIRNFRQKENISQLMDWHLPSM